MSFYGLLAKIFKMRYNGGTIGKEVPTVEEKTKKTLSDYGLGVLYYKCKKISKASLNALTEYQDIISAITNYSGAYSDEYVCEVVSDYALRVITSGGQYGKIKRLARTIQKSVHGEYLDGFQKEDQSPNPPADLEYLLDVLSDLRRSPKRHLFAYDRFVTSARKTGHISTVQQAYDVFKRAFFQEVRSGLKEKDYDSYKHLRVIAMDFCRVLYGDINRWHSDYEAYWSGK